MSLLFPPCGVVLVLATAAPPPVPYSEALQILAAELSNWPVPPLPLLLPMTALLPFLPGPPTRAAPPCQSQTTTEKGKKKTTTRGRITARLETSVWMLLITAEFISILIKIVAHRPEWVMKWNVLINELKVKKVELCKWSDAAVVQEHHVCLYLTLKYLNDEIIIHDLGSY